MHCLGLSVGAGRGLLVVTPGAGGSLPAGTLQLTHGGDLERQPPGNMARVAESTFYRYQLFESVGFT
ncbi:hypothetical protein GCM10009742_35780 [Kribbella karoonensis]|uniref:Uncharacterized protein n=1 Tax=Kribbella karoonensis TaxID=324851 RepID=A0ABP4PUF3_9ACTN